MQANTLNQEADRAKQKAQDLAQKSAHLNSTAHVLQHNASLGKAEVNNLNPNASQNNSAQNPSL